MLYLLNALPGGALLGHRFIGGPIALESVRRALRESKWESAVGHDGTAAALTAILGVEIPTRRVTVVPQSGDSLIVAALRGPRLAEGQVLTRQEVEARGFDFLEVAIY
jgi:hypothetical protein